MFYSYDFLLEKIFGVLRNEMRKKNILEFIDCL